MVTLSKTKKIETLAKLLQKRYKGLPMPPERKVLEHLIFGAVLENATFEQATAAYAVLENYFIDWNEIRVSTIKELADTFPMLPDPLAAGERVRKTLQKVFEKTYMYDLEDLQKKGKNLGQTVEYLTSMKVGSRFMIQYTTLLVLGGHVIPLDEASLRVFRLLGMAQVAKDNTFEEAPGLERVIAKKTGLLFFTHLHQFAASYYSAPESEELRSFLSSVDPDVVKRDWVPPVLVVPKVSAQKVERPVKPMMVPLPFIVPDDDVDEEEERDGTEAEFISEGPDYLAGTPTVSKQPEHKRQDAGLVKKTSVSEQKGKTAKKNPVIKPEQTPVQDKPVASQEKTAATSPVKTSSPKVAEAETAKKSPPEKDITKAKSAPTKLTAENKTTVKAKPTEPTKPTEATKPQAAKSPIRQLREKKPK